MNLSVGIVRTQHDILYLSKKNKLPALLKFREIIARDKAGMIINSQPLT